MIPLSLFLLACAGVYVAAIQSAFHTLMRVQLRLLAEGSGLAPDLDRYLQDPLRLFIPVRCLLGLIEGFTVLLLARMIGLGNASSFLLLAVSMVAFGAVCEFLLPFLIVARDPERVLELLLPSFRWVSRPLEPVTLGLIHLINHPKRERVTPVAANGEEPARGNGLAVNATETAEEAAQTHQEERKLLKSIVDFSDTLVREVMTPRPDIVAVDSDATLEELKALFREQEYSRIPVYKENLDNIVGFVFLKDLVLLEAAPAGDQSITSFLRPAHFVPETKPVTDLLREFQQQRVQSAIVVDEYGGTAGLVTLEDLLEELVGEIRDEYDVETEPIVDEGNGSFVFSGTVDVDEIVDRLKVAIEREGFESVGGYLLSRLGRVPAIGETFEIDGLNIQVVEAERRRIRKVRIARAEPVAQHSGHAGE
ncbi:MAG TPA: hemolysin family protein [Vicinamibacterales bacterium]|jgi:CBS domain containing-hemolysin-like protein|nr:hemolysin family protein [Vicinamibacterales bacterium]